MPKKCDRCLTTDLPKFICHIHGPKKLNLCHLCRRKTNYEVYKYDLICQCIDCENSYCMICLDDAIFIPTKTDGICIFCAAPKIYSYSLDCGYRYFERIRLNIKMLRKIFATIMAFRSMTLENPNNLLPPESRRIPTLVMENILEFRYQHRDIFGQAFTFRLIERIFTNRLKI